MEILIGVIIAVLGLLGYVIQSDYTKKREIEIKEYIFRREHYIDLIRTISHGIHTVQTKKEPTSMDYKEELDKLNLIRRYSRTF